MSKFIISSLTDDEDERYYYITFNEQRSDDAKNIAEELNIPLEKYIEICKNNGGYKYKQVTDCEDCFKSIFEAQNALQEILEFSIEYNKNNQYNCDCEDVGIPVFPNDFKKSKTEICTSENIINKWINECIDDLENNLEVDSIEIQDNNSIVIINRIYPCENCEEYYYKIIVSNNYFEYDGYENMNCELIDDFND